MNCRIPFVLRLACLWLYAAVFAQAASAQNNYQFARNIGGPGDGQVHTPYNVAIDPAGNVYVADYGNNRIQKFDSDGNFLLAFGSYGTGAGQFNYPRSVTTDGAGNVYVADGGNNRVEKFDSQGHFLLKFGAYGSGKGLFYGPNRVAADSAGNVYVSDSSPYIQKFDHNGKYRLQFTTQSSNPSYITITSLAVDSAGIVYVTDFDYTSFRSDGTQKFNGQGTYLSTAGAVAYSVDSAGNLYYFYGGYPSGGGVVQKYDRNGALLLTFGTGGSGDGQLNSPSGLAVDGAGNIYVCDQGNNRIQKFGPDGAYMNQFGNRAPGDGALNNPAGLALDGAGNLYVCDENNSRIQKFAPNGAFLLKFGGRGSGDGQFIYPIGVAVDSAGGIYVADYSNDRIQKFDSQGNLLLKFGTYGSGDDQLYGPSGVAVDSIGNIYVADSGNDRIKIFSARGEYFNQLGYGTFYSSGGSGAGQLSVPEGVAVDSSGAVYVADTNNNRVEEFAATGAYVSQFATNGYGAGQFSFVNTSSVAVDGAGNIYVNDSYHALVQKYSSKGILLAGFGSGYNGVPGMVGGSGGGGAYLSSPQGVAVDSAGNVFIADANNNRVAEFAPANASVSGILSFDGIDAGAAAQNVTFTFRSSDGSADLVQTLAVPASGAFTLSGLFSKAGILHIKPSAYLAVNVPVDLTGGSLSGQSALLEPGDANNDNSVDSADFGVLIGAFGSAASFPGSGYDATADFNGDGFVDSTDFGLLIGSFNLMGDP